ncbi:MAG: hypothetical protein ACTSVK_14945 [Promethearchaeota archaeon]
MPICEECNKTEAKHHCLRCERWLCTNCFGKSWNEHPTLCIQCLFDLDDQNN